MGYRGLGKDIVEVTLSMYLIRAKLIFFHPECKSDQCVAPSILKSQHGENRALVIRACINLPAVFFLFCL
jgi:hypothetical protein